MSVSDPIEPRNLIHESRASPVRHRSFPLAVAHRRSHADGTYPSRPLRLVVPFPPEAGTSTSSARILAPDMARELGQPFVVDNKPGAAGITGLGCRRQAQPPMATRWASPRR